MHVEDIQAEMIAATDKYGDILYDDRNNNEDDSLSQLGDYLWGTPSEMSSSIFEELIINLKDSDTIDDMIDSVIYAQARLIDNGEIEKADELLELETALRKGKDESTIRAIVARICA